MAGAEIGLGLASTVVTNGLTMAYDAIPFNRKNYLGRRLASIFQRGDNKLRIMLEESMNMDGKLQRAAEIVKRNLCFYEISDGLDVIVKLQDLPSEKATWIAAAEDLLQKVRSESDSSKARVRALELGAFVLLLRVIHEKSGYKAFLNTFGTDMRQIFLANDGGELFFDYEKELFGESNFFTLTNAKKLQTATKSAFASFFEYLGFLVDLRGDFDCSDLSSLNETISDCFPNWSKSDDSGIVKLLAWALDWKSSVGSASHLVDQNGAVLQEYILNEAKVHFSKPLEGEKLMEVIFEDIVTLPKNEERSGTKRLAVVGRCKMEQETGNVCIFVCELERPSWLGTIFGIKNLALFWDDQIRSLSIAAFVACSVENDVILWTKANREPMVYCYNDSKISVAKEEPYGPESLLFVNAFTVGGAVYGVLEKERVFIDERGRRRKDKDSIFYEQTEPGSWSQKATLESTSGSKTGGFMEQEKTWFAGVSRADRSSRTVKMISNEEVLQEIQVSDPILTLVEREGLPYAVCFKDEVCVLVDLLRNVEVGRFDGCPDGGRILKAVGNSSEVYGLMQIGSDGMDQEFHLVVARIDSV